MKLTKSQLKELIRYSIIEMSEEEKEKSEPSAPEKEKPTTDISDNPFDDKEAAEESMKKRRYTVKEVRMWMKKLEENRYKKVYNSDARRVAWMVNNEGVELSEMPKSMSKKWTKAQYGRERYLAKEFLKSKSEQLSEGSLKQAMKQWKYLEKTLTPHKKKFIKKRLKSLKPKMDKYFKNKDYQDYIDGELSKKVPLPDLMFGKGKEFGQLISAYSNAIKEPEYYKFDEGKLTEAISGSDRKILFILVREIVRNLKSKIKNFDVNNKSHMNRVGSSILAIIRAMTYSPDNANYKNFKKYFPKNFNSKLIQKKLKQFHSQNDKVQVTLVTQAIKNELGEGVNESKLRGMIREIIKEQMNEKINLGGAYEKMLDKHTDKIAQNALSLVRNKIMKDYKVGKKSPKSSEKVTRRLVATLINNGMKEIRNKAKSPGLKKAFQKIIDIREKELKKMKEGKLTEVKFKKVILPNDMKTKVKVSKMIKQLKLKIDKDYDVKALKARGGDQVISILPKHYNKFIELAMKNKLNPRG